MSTKTPYISGIGLALIGLAVFSGCEIINPEEEIPSFIYIEEIELQSTDPGTHGTVSANITDAWVFVDDDIIGTFELPATIPVLDGGTHKLTVLPGIKKNGISATRSVYPLYTEWTDQIFELIRDSTVVAQPVVEYRPQNTFAWREDFEDVGVSLTSSGLANISRVEHADDTPNSGDYIGRIVLQQPDTNFTLATEQYELPRSGTTVYLELDFRCDIPFFITMRTESTSGLKSDLTILQLQRSSMEWRKVYVDLTDLVSNEFNAVGHQFVFSAILPEGDSNGIVDLDNLKLIHQ